MATDAKPLKEPAEAVIKKSIAKMLKEKELANDVLYKKVKIDTGHGISKIKKYLNEMVGAGAVEEKRRKPPDRNKTTYALTNEGRERWL
jgi:DNA-binding PadR family transcriptional regulator